MPTIASGVARMVPSASTIAAELRRDFSRLLEDRYGAAALPDPVLATLFHAFAARIAVVYEEAEHVFPEAVLDDLVAGLEMPARTASPAQAVVSFSRVARREHVGADVQLNGYLKSGARVGFVPDVGVDIAPATLAFAAVAQRGRLQTIPGAQTADETPLPPASVAHATRDVGATIYLALRTDDEHLSSLGIYIDAGPRESPAAGALDRACWQLLDSAGHTARHGVLRPKPARGGVHRLVWTDDVVASPHAEISEIESADSYLVPLFAGPYGHQVWVFPHIPSPRRWCGDPPPAIATVASNLMPDEMATALDGPLAWVQIDLPDASAGIAESIHRVAANCVTVSNVEGIAERVAFDRLGTSVGLRPEEDPDRYLLGISSVVGETGTRYIDEHIAKADMTAGRFQFAHGVLSVRPALKSTGRYDTYAMAHLLYCDGSRANGIEVGDICTSNSRLANLTACIRNLTVSRGGTAPPPYATARVRFAEALRSRDRIVTASDIEIAAVAFEPRVHAVVVTPECERQASGVVQVDRVAAHVRPQEFVDPAADLDRLRDRLERHLQDRATIGQCIRVTIVEGA